ncbi:Ribonuclease E [Sphingobium herbicidovorans NBRC 16415]|uniref:Ribonuclease E n=1 Tax=Sphingobium herbicidovorans (strain ATCC 700291 / DSM 11019 / CCUG 56400 / KCTC 2939 / LMG 18315 / NBRC 16415 / MH) TaxID=1219045 RepID=A0A086P7B1_SPHHM|nr:ribonuclease E/G [Sphingobium herbicidovorans]KFG89279.1 Ribonuclease E [Sphingobium herbicidovorans NBRC 16415]
MTMRMLIDARHREETRVAVVKGNRIEEFDFESAEHKQLKGNIYLAKVTRVEPSLQAAFVDYGGNRHGFLAFSEIHPDYYQIPREDREALLREERAHAEEEAALRADYDDEDDHHGEDGVEVVEATHHEEEEGEAAESSEGGDKPGRRKRGGDDAADELRRKRMALRRRYKIQDVIKRRQVLLVQVVKEERGNKGAALTTYLSLAGRYCVLMPNTSHGGGISRKISNAADRKRLKSIVAEMALPSSMGCIVRTAGLQRTKPEIKRDFDYLARLWDEIRENTLKSAAPALIHNDSDLIKRAIRDIYNKDIDEVIVEGEEGYRAAKDFMKLLMPSHARRVQQYADAVSLFQRAGVEEQLAAMYNPVVQLKSGGYLVINPTEALVSIDINSGRSTREHGIEQTAVATNLEAAREIARQLRLRDMAGLVVIDFIDMEMNSNIRKVEKAMKEALKDDRARIQVGRISGFGLMEMSRQRLRTGVLEASTRQCPHCEGTGLVRTASSAGLSALRMLEEEAARGRGSLVTLRASQEAAFYVLNNKRAELDEIEQRYGVRIEILPDGEVEGARMSVEASGPRPERVVSYAPLVEEDDDLDIVEELEEEEIEEVEAAEREERGDRGEDREGGRRRRRRRRRRGGQRDEHRADGETEAASDVEGEAEDESALIVEDAEQEPVEASDEGEEGARRRGRRGRRGGRRRREGGEGVAEDAAAETAEAAADTVAAEEVAEAAVDAAPEAPAEEEAPKTRRRPRARKAKEAVETPAEPVEVEAVEAIAEAPAEEAPAKPKRTRRKKADVAAEAPAEAPPTVEAEAEVPAKPKRTRRKKADALAQDAAEAPSIAEPVTAQAAAETEPVGANDVGNTLDGADAADAQTDDDSAPRRGWWQRTFGQ